MNSQICKDEVVEFLGFRIGRYCKYSGKIKQKFRNNLTVTTEKKEKKKQQKPFYLKVWEIFASAMLSYRKKGV